MALALGGLMVLALPSCGDGGGDDDTIVKPMDDYREAAEKSIDKSNAQEERDRLEREIKAEGE